MLQCNISYSRDSRHPYAADVGTFAQTLPTLQLSERDGTLARYRFQAALVPLCGLVWEQHRSSARGGPGQMGQSDSFMWKELEDRWDCWIPSSLYQECVLDPLFPAEIQGDGGWLLSPPKDWKTLERKDSTDSIFTEENILPPLSFSLPIKSEIMPCLAELHVYLSMADRGKTNTVLPPACVPDWSFSGSVFS